MKCKEITPADRVLNIKEYYFSRKLREIAGLKASGKDIISLGIGGPDLPPAPEVVDALCESAQRADTHSYQPYVGIPELRRAYGEWYRRIYGVVLNPDTEIQPLIGSKEGILHVSMAFLNPGDGVLVPNPGYPTYTSVSKICGATIYEYSLSEESGWMPDFDELEKLPLEHIKLMWVNYPNMPTGTPANMPLFEKLIAFGKRHGIVIVHDNPYSFILNDTPLSILSVPGAKEIAIEFNSLSKSHNMAGWRMAMVASNPEFISWILKVKSNIDSGQFRPMMLAAVKALEVPDEWYRQINRTYSRRRQVAEKIAHAAGCTFDASQQGLFLWVKVPDWCPDGETLADKLLYEADVFVTPGIIFGSQGRRYIRISLCLSEERMNEALKRIEVVMNLAH